jgi:hypothetical protein
VATTWSLEEKPSLGARRRNITLEVEGSTLEG